MCKWHDACSSNKVYCNKSEIPTQLENELQNLVKVRKHSEVGDLMSGLRWHKLYWKMTNPKETALLAREFTWHPTNSSWSDKEWHCTSTKNKMQISPAHMSLSNSFTSFLIPDKPEHLNPGKNTAAKPEARPQINLRLLKSNSTASALRKIQSKRRMLHLLANLPNAQFKRLRGGWAKENRLGRTTTLMDIRSI